MSGKRFGDLIGICKQKHDEKNILVTGATGFLGSNFLFWRLRLPGKIFLLVRGDSIEHAQERVLSAIRVCAESYNLPTPYEELKSKVIYVSANIDFPVCGLSEKNIARLKDARIVEIWHCAASLAFRDEHKDKIYRSNVEGTLNVLELGRYIGAGRYIHISTAYTAGDRSGDIEEELHPKDLIFNNYYEESKNIGEHTVFEYCQKYNLNWSIVRPSIIMGPYISKRSGSTDFGVYGFAKELYRLKSTLKKVANQIALSAHKDAVANLVPVDQVVYDMLYLSMSGFGDQKIYHSCGAVDFSIGKIIKEIEYNCDLDLFDFGGVREKEATPLEVMFDRRTEFYGGYFHTLKKFNRSLPRHRSLNFDDVKNYLSNYFRKLEEDKVGNQLQRYQLNSFDGLPICAYTTGNSSNSPIILINACGMPNDFMLPLAKRLADQYFVITWDSRWIPSLTHEFDPEICNSLSFSKDLISVMNYFSIEKSSIVGWSSGVQVALRAMHAFPERIDKAVLLNGGTSIRADDSMGVTEYEQNIMSLLPKIKAKYRLAEMYCDLIYGTKLHEKNEADSGVFNNILASTDPYLLYMTSMPFRSPEALYRYAHIMTNLLNEKDDAWASNIKHPVMVYTCENDKVAHKDSSIALARRLDNSTFFLDKEEDHFAQFYQDHVAKLIADFIKHTTAEQKVEINENALV